jgi:hypothetical protein
VGRESLDLHVRALRQGDEEVEPAELDDEPAALGLDGLVREAFRDLALERRVGAVRVQDQALHVRAQRLDKALLLGIVQDHGVTPLPSSGRRVAHEKMCAGERFLLVLFLRARSFGAQHAYAAAGQAWRIVVCVHEGVRVLPRRGGTRTLSAFV